MLTVITLLRGINVGGHNQIKMDALRALCESLGLKEPRTYVQSGNLVFKTEERNLVRLAGRIESEIEKKFGFRPGVIQRTSSDLKNVVAKNPFARRSGIDPRKLAVVFFNEAPAAEACDQVLAMKAQGEEVHIDGREFYIYFPEVMGRSKLFAAIGRKLQSGTTRNWKTVTTLLDMANER
jgi:uncharacterized protein (DUF1697 family)